MPETAVVPKPTQDYVFVWENLGPTHIDRLGALADAIREIGGRVSAIQFFDRSGAYLWDGVTEQPFAVTTLRRDPWPGLRLGLILPLIRACLRVDSRNVFLCHYQEVPVMIAAVVLRLLGRRVFTLIDSKFDDYPRRFRTEWIKRLFLMPYHGVLTASTRSRDYLTFLGFRPDRIALGYDTLSIDRITALSGAPPAPDGVPFGERDFVVVARHVPKKNIAVAIDAFAAWLQRTDRPRRLQLCGSGELEADLRAQVERLGVAAEVCFRGFVQTEKVSRQLAHSLCLILPSIEEQYGLVVIEAQATGLPVLVSRNAGAADILIDDGRNGFTFNPHDADSLAALMLLLSEDEARWRSMATAARDGRYRGDARHFVAGVRALTG